MNNTFIFAAIKLLLQTTASSNYMYGEKKASLETL